MVVVVKDNKLLDIALALLQREVSRERVLKTYREQRYYVSKSVKRHVQKIAWARAKKWRRRARKRRINKGME